VITTSDEFTAADAQLARQNAQEIVDHRHIVDFVIDLEKTRFIDSAALDTMLWIQSKAQHGAGQLKLANVNDICRKILQLTRLDQRLQCHSDVNNAIKALG